MGNSIRKAERAHVTADYARQILDYDPETGVFRWRSRPGRRCIIGAVATAIQKGRNTVKLGGTRFQASNVAWLCVHGEWPDFEVDHHDQNKFNDAIGNLRPSNTSKNMMNRGKTAANKSGFKGVSPHGDGFVVWIGVDNRKYYLGWFKEASQGAAAYRIAASVLHGEFSGV